MRPSLLPSLLALTLGSALAQAAAPLPADDPTWRHCGPVVGFPWETPLRPLDDSDTAANLAADRFDVSGKDVYRAEGAVVIDQPGRRILADAVDYTHSSGDYLASGDVRYLDTQIAISATSARGNLVEQRSQLDQLDYRLVAARGNGRADSATLQGPLATLLGLGYSTCNPGDQAWRLDARQLDLDRESGVGTARDATLRLGKVPVLWLPYLSFPIDERRQSGLLMPSIGSAGDTGIDVRVPYYLNLAPHYDATLTPRLLGRRGVMLGAEFRYLGESHGGRIEGNWLPDDRLTDRDRGSLRIRHLGVLSPHWGVAADLNHVSDARYFEDFGDSLSARSTSLLESNAGLYGRGAGWNASLSAQAWDVTDPLVPEAAEPFRRLPRARANWQRAFGPQLLVGVGSEAVRFDHVERPGATRYDLMPWVELPFERAAGYLRPRLAWRQTGYRLDREYAAGFADRSPDRGLPIYSLDAALNFERSTSLFGAAMLQTLQPRLFYLKVPFEDQSGIPQFDTQELTFGFDQLFRSNRFSGADRQGDAHQATLAVSSRWFEMANGRERLAASLGQIRYFDPPRVGLGNSQPPEINASAYVAAVEVALSPRSAFGASYQWDPETERNTVTGLRATYRGDAGALANLAYRYRRDELEQADASFALPMGGAWRWIGRWNYSMRDASTLEAFGGFEWQGCCLALRVLGRHYVRNREGEKNNALYVELELKGLASLGRDTEDFLQRAILGYSR